MINILNVKKHCGTCLKALRKATESECLEEFAHMQYCVLALKVKKMSGVVFICHLISEKVH